MSIKAIFILNITLFSFQQGIAQCPYNSCNWKHEPYHLAIGAVTMGTGIIFASNVQGFSEEEIALLDRNDIGKFDRGATYNSSISANTASDILLYSSALLPLTLLASKNSRKDFGRIAILYGETAFITAGITYFTKGVILRTRPFVYNEDFSLAEKEKPGARHSFFSGHTSLTAASCFFTAKVFSDYYPDSKLKPYVWAGAIVLPAVTGYLRIAAGKHFRTDVITGYIIGASIGYLVPQLHKKVKIGDADTSVSLNLGATGAALTWKFY